VNPILGQWMTPEWMAERLVERYFSDLSMFDQVIEPSCGTGSFLGAVPAHVPAIGVEIDPALAAIAQQDTGRRVIVGDFAAVDLPIATAIIGNPPFKLRTIEQFLARAFELLEDGGRVGFILPAYTFQTSSTTLRIAQRWHIQQDAIPREFFPKISVPVCFAQFTKGRRGLVGFALYHDAGAINALERRYRTLLAQGERSAWAAVTRAAMEKLGGEAALPDLYREIEGARPSANRFWQAKVRQQVQRMAVRTGRGRWALPMQAAA
jgi:predicted RNA methylase